MGRLPETGPSLRRYLTQQKRQANRAGDASPFTRSGSGVTGVDELAVEGLLRIIGQMVVDGTLIVNGPTALDGDTVVAGSLTSADFDGDLATGDAGTTGWAMNAARVAIGELFLRPGSVGNDALANPLEVRSNYGNEDTFAVTTTPTARGTFTITVPAGFTAGLVTINTYLQVVNSTASTQYAYVRAYVNGPGGYSAWGARSMVTIAAGFTATIQAYTARAITAALVGGDTLSFFAEVHASATLASSASNYAGGEALATFTR